MAYRGRGSGGMAAHGQPEGPRNAWRSPVTPARRLIGCKRVVYTRMFLETLVYYVILTAGRSGSTLLGNALQTHPHILSFGELLDIPEPPEPLWLKDKSVSVRQIRPGESWHEYLA